ncbi:alpha-galactosidase [Mucilaginibacter sp. UR6-11]|uniref:alpha-galactosidase n=1 Tax=Mucilaginibacter sp. UR6-11 TaxID=1435644 RepID=UPI001E45DA57|nr:alpha-galactosidase [Mucilaginibacter sp. UR6-11]MCC8423601.1 alpha-galactosidase [Mucilaginibacter sp. UR6-11]
MKLTVQLLGALTGVVMMAAVVGQPRQAGAVKTDWLVRPVRIKVQVLRSTDGKDLILNNGLLKRVFRISPNLACYDLVNLGTGRQLLRAVREEARLTIDGRSYAVGGLRGQPEMAYLKPAWLDQLRTGPGDFQYTGYQVSAIRPELHWKKDFWALSSAPGTGRQLSFFFRPSAPELDGLSVQVNYELYDGIPLMVKSLVLKNKGKKVFRLERVVSEVLAMAEEEGAVGDDSTAITPPKGMYIETNYAFNNAMVYPYSDQTTHWRTDPAYTSQVSYNKRNPCLLEVYPGDVTGIELRPGEIFQSVRTHELLIDSYDRERRGLAIRRMYPKVAPWVTANPIFMHLVSENDQQVLTAIDQCAATGYEAVILSFGSHLNIEDTTAANLRRWQNMAAYAHRKGVKLGCYSLFSSRHVSDRDDVIDPKTGKPDVHALFGQAPCFGSSWGLWYRDNIKRFFSLTGFDLFENDGPYPGDLCASTTHPGHQGLGDSQWQQIGIQKELYHWLNERGIYINSPDWYFLDGSNKIQMGYKESNFQLPREQQLMLNRQNIYDALWEKTTSMGWGFVPLTEYGGGGPAATIEPLKEHLRDYEQLMMQYYGAGIQACYRGPRLYDSEQTKLMVTRVINWYKRYRDILNSDVIHLRRADGRDWDGILHVNPSLKTKGLVMLYNPLQSAITRTIKLPLYYSGLTRDARIREQEGVPHTYRLNRDYTVQLTFHIPSESYTWFVIE